MPDSDGTAIRILLVDDHEVVRAGFRRLLESDSDLLVVAEACDGQEAYREFVEACPHVVVMDLSMPGMSGFEASRRILARDPKARILVFSVHETQTYLERVLDLGILGYITKRSASRVMAEAVRCVARGERYIGPELLRYLESRESVPPSRRIQELTPREFEVFCHLAEGRTVQDIAGILNISPKTAGNHYTQVKKKLGASSTAELTLLAVRSGLISV